MTQWLPLIGGLVVLVGGAELLVRGAAGLAARLGISPLVIGLTVVAFGTSSPEVAVSLDAVFSQRHDIAIGNAVGSNTFNVLFILGISALVCPLAVAQKLIRVDVPIMIGVSALLWLLARDGELGRLDGVILFIGIVAYTIGAVRSSRRETPEVRQEYQSAPDLPRHPSLLRAIGFTAFGLGLAVFGARWFVMGAVAIATDLGVSELVIGLTIVAAGTSLPEVATSLVAAIRGQRDIAVGNVIGSNIFNVLFILGLAGIVAPDGLLVSSAVLAFDMPVMLAVTVACLPIVFTGGAIRRWEGGLLLAGYVAYVVYLVLDAANHDALSGFSMVMVWFALPLAAIGIAGSLLASRPHAGAEC
ncbi:MAG: calcium/sodium antiporter [Phycisphaerales bacterium]|nr:calcium/sodium antiporter [Phycisphaerales bacterium]NNM25974.1 calcium/sodium antiporter [Phycisphaerales bacterium]